MSDSKKCPTCGQNISEREIALYRGLVVALWKVFNFLGEKGSGYKFSRKEIKHLFTEEGETARFGDWVFFGGLVFKYAKGQYGLNIERCESFFRGEYEIPIRVWKNPVTGEIKREDYRTIHKIPKLIECLNEDGSYNARYREPQRELF